MTELEQTMFALRRHAETIRGAELAQARKLSPAGRDALEAVTARIVHEFLRVPSVRVEEADGDRYADILRHLFALEDAA